MRDKIFTFLSINIIILLCFIWFLSSAIINMKTKYEINYNVMCNYDLYDCSHFASQDAAQIVYMFCFDKSGDIHKLDSDNDGYACDDL